MVCRREAAVFQKLTMIEEMNPLPTGQIDALLTDYKRPENLTGHNNLFKRLSKALVDWVLQAELTDHMSRSKNQLVASEASNKSNGLGRKTLKGD